MPILGSFIIPGYVPLFQDFDPEQETVVPRKGTEVDEQL